MGNRGTNNSLLGALILDTILMYRAGLHPLVSPLSHDQLTAVRPAHRLLPDIADKARCRDGTSTESPPDCVRDARGRRPNGSSVLPAHVHPALRRGAAQV